MSTAHAQSVFFSNACAFWLGLRCKALDVAPRQHRRKMNFLHPVQHTEILQKHGVPSTFVITNLSEATSIGTSPLTSVLHTLFDFAKFFIRAGFGLIWSFPYAFACILHFIRQRFSTGGRPERWLGITRTITPSRISDASCFRYYAQASGNSVPCLSFWNGWSSNRRQSSA